MYLFPFDAECFKHSSLLIEMTMKHVVLETTIRWRSNPHSSLYNMDNSASTLPQIQGSIYFVLLNVFQEILNKHMSNSIFILHC